MNSQPSSDTRKIFVTVEVFLQDYQAIRSLIQDEDPDREAISQAISRIVRSWQSASLNHYEPVEGEDAKMSPLQ